MGKTRKIKAGKRRVLRGGVRDGYDTPVRRTTAIDPEMITIHDKIKNFFINKCSEYLINHRDTGELTENQKNIIDNKVQQYKSHIVHTSNQKHGFFDKYVMPKNAYANYLRSRSRVKTNRTWKNWGKGKVNSIKIYDKDIENILKELEWNENKLYKSITSKQMELIGLTLREKVILEKFENLDALQSTDKSNPQLEKIIDDEITRLKLESGDELAPTFTEKHRALAGYNSRDFNPKKNWKVRGEEPDYPEPDY